MSDPAPRKITWSERLLTLGLLLAVTATVLAAG